MLMNCDSANKLVKQLQADKAAIQTKEAQNASYSYLNGETPEKPEYDFAETQAALRRPAALYRRSLFSNSRK